MENIVHQNETKIPILNKTHRITLLDSTYFNNFIDNYIQFYKSRAQYAIYNREITHLITYSHMKVVPNNKFWILKIPSENIPEKKLHNKKEQLTSAKKSHEPDRQAFDIHTKACHRKSLTVL